MALENDDLIIVQKGDGSLAKATVGSARVTTPNLQAVTDVGSNTTNGATFAGTITSTATGNYALSLNGNGGISIGNAGDGNIYLKNGTDATTTIDLEGLNGNATFGGSITAGGYSLANLTEL